MTITPPQTDKKKWYHLEECTIWGTLNDSNPRNNDSEDGGHHMVRLTIQMLRHTKTMRIRVFRDSIAKEGGRHMASPRKCRA
ncbi:hypothetical protein RHGRI_020412 [Rhododendron griersonianum]|uniref:Uncharacterized protein n=1 Tax=Rhododendron griersonianum TaxID=479676 RepID=A0AAV6JI94_9ERIC|nr:hypothetical protein RHGRI_020412 [Rhododendron griersonianum]